MRVGGSSRFFRFRWSFHVIAQEFLSAATSVAEFIERDGEEPGGEARASVEGAELSPHLQKCLLREVIGQMRVAVCHAREEGAHGRLIAPHQFAESILVFMRQDARDEISISKGHVLLRQSVLSLVPDQSDQPDNEQGYSNEERNESEPAHARCPSKHEHANAHGNQN